MSDERRKLYMHIADHIQKEAGEPIARYSMAVAGLVMKALDSWIEEQQQQSDGIKVGDKVHLNKDLTAESNSRTEELCGVEEDMQGFGGDYVGEVLSIEPSDVNPKYEVCLIRFINGYEWYYAAEDLENST